MYHEDQLLPISALQHLIFCERQCALIHVERLWAENRLTVEGRHLHERAHQGADEFRRDVTVARGMPIRSRRWGLIGVADVVELHYHDGDGPQSRRAGSLSRVVPVEYKRGRPKKDDSDRVQLCAQSLCLEEMFSCQVGTGYLFYGKRKRRTEISIDRDLRARTVQAIARLREIIDNRETPRARREPKCDSCSLLQLCLPEATQPSSNATTFFQQELAAATASEGPSVDLEFDAF